MASALPINSFREHSLVWAIALSIALHALATLTANPFDFDSPSLKLPIEVRLLPPPEPEPPPPPLVEPEPPKPAPPPPRPQPKVLPKTVEPPRIQPEPMTQPLPQPVIEQPREVPPPAPPPVIAAAPRVEEPPAFVAPPPPPATAGPTPQEISTAKDNYGSLLARAFARHKQYPRLAQMRGWQGTARVRLEIAADGSVVSTAISESSGHDILDRQALEMVKKATPLPQPPEQLRNQAFTVIVPVVFRLE